MRLTTEFLYEFISFLSAECLSTVCGVFPFLRNVFAVNEYCDAHKVRTCIPAFVLGTQLPCQTRICFQNTLPSPHTAIAQLQYPFDHSTTIVPFHYSLTRDTLRWFHSYPLTQFCGHLWWFWWCPLTKSCRCPSTILRMPCTVRLIEKVTIISFVVYSFSENHLDYPLKFNAYPLTENH